MLPAVGVYVVPDGFLPVASGIEGCLIEEIVRPRRKAELRVQEVPLDRVNGHGVLDMKTLAGQALLNGAIFHLVGSAFGVELP